MCIRDRYYALRVAPKFISKTAAPLRHGAAALMMECLPLFLSMFLMNILINASKYGIEFLMDDTAQGYYCLLYTSYVNYGNLSRNVTVYDQNTKKNVTGRLRDIVVQIVQNEVGSGLGLTGLDARRLYICLLYTSQVEESVCWRFVVCIKNILKRIKK